MRVARWGNSLAIRIPAAVVDGLELKEGDEIEVHMADAGRVEVSRKPTPRELLDRLDKYRDLIPADWKFDRMEANARR